MDPNPENITALLEAVDNGDSKAFHDLFAAVYSELKKIARKAMMKERPDHTLQATALVHDLFVSFGRKTNKKWLNRSHFYSAAARAMKNLLIDHYRHLREKHAHDHVAIDEGNVPIHTDIPLDLINEMEQCQAALDAFASEPGRERKVRVFEMVYFLSWSKTKVAKVENISRKTVRQDLVYTLAWLRRKMLKAGQNEHGTKGASRGAFS
ncbi:MAG: ECF-type sigma factor [Planctomycetota bacterium]